MKARWLCGLALVAATLAHGQAAKACDCYRRGPNIFPGKDAVAPLNTRVWVFDAPATGKYALVKGEAAVPLTSSEYFVPGDRGEGFQAPNAQHVVELKPIQPLEPRTRYDVVLDDGKQPKQTLGSVTTGDALDQAPAAWSGPRSVDVTEDDLAPEGCKIGMSQVIVWLDERGAASLEGQVLLAAYARVPGRAQKPLVSVHRLRHTANGNLARLEGGGLCDPRNFDFPAPLEKGELVLSLIDMAGNASAEHQRPMIGPLSAWDRALLRRADKLVSVRAAREAEKDRDQSALWLAFGLGVLGLVVAVVVVREK